MVREADKDSEDFLVASQVGLVANKVVAYCRIRVRTSLEFPLSFHVFEEVIRKNLSSKY